MTSKPQIQVSLLLMGQGFLPKDVSAVIQLAPTKTWRVGDTIGKSIRKHKNDGWEFGLPQREMYDLDASLRELLDEVEPYKDRIAQAVNQFALEKEVSCAIYIRDEMPICSLAAKTIQRFANLGLGFDIDLILVP